MPWKRMLFPWRENNLRQSFRCSSVPHLFGPLNTVRWTV